MSGPLSWPAAGGLLAGSDALLFSVFLLLAGFMAALVAKTPTDPPRTATVLSSPAERAGGLPSPLSTNTTTALSRLEKLRTTWPRRRVPQDAVQSLTAIGSFSLRAEDLFVGGQTTLRPEGKALLYRLATTLTGLTPEEVVLTITYADDAQARSDRAARLGTIAGRLVDFGAPAMALRLGTRESASTALEFRLEPSPWAPLP